MKKDGGLHRMGGKIDGRKIKKKFCGRPTLCGKHDIPSVASLPTLVVHRWFGGMEDLRNGKAHV